MGLRPFVPPYDRESRFSIRACKADGTVLGQFTPGANSTPRNWYVTSFSDTIWTREQDDRTLLGPTFKEVPYVHGERGVFTVKMLIIGAVTFPLNHAEDDPHSATIEDVLGMVNPLNSNFISGNYHAVRTSPGDNPLYYGVNVLTFVRKKPSDINIGAELELTCKLAELTDRPWPPNGRGPA